MTAQWHRSLHSVYHCLFHCLCVQDVEFKEGEKEHFVAIEILYDGQREMREAFTVHMKPDDNMVAEIQVTQRPHHTYTLTNISQWPVSPVFVRILYSAT